MNSLRFREAQLQRETAFGQQALVKPLKKV